MNHKQLGAARLDPPEGLQLQWDLLPASGTGPGTASKTKTSSPGTRPTPTAEAELVRLHDADVASFAIVYRGQIAYGGWRAPVAIKVQRDSSRAKDGLESIIAKFNSERAIHRALQGPAHVSGRTELPVVSLHEIGAEGDEAAKIDPTILCRRATHALAPLCPRCRKPLVSPEDRMDMTAASAGDIRLLRCPICNAGWEARPENKYLIRQASVGSQPACKGCPHEGKGATPECMAESAFLNFFEARLLVFELLDLSLADYLRWRVTPGHPFGRPGIADALREHQHARQGPLDRPIDPLDRLRLVCDLLGDVLDGLDLLHNNKKAHLDLKPDNVCLRLDRDRIRAKLIDLGLAKDPEAPAKFREAMEIHGLLTDYAAPEVRHPKEGSIPFEIIDTTAKRIKLLIDSKNRSANEDNGPLIVPGDVVSLRTTNGSYPTPLEVLEVGPDGGRFEMIAQSVEGTPHGLPKSGTGELTICKVTGPGADYYSLGLVVFSLVLGRPDVKAVLASIPNLIKTLQTLAAETPQRAPPLARTPGRGVIRRLVGQKSVYLREFYELHGSLSGIYLRYSFLAEELLGLALRCVIRGISEWSLSRHRGDWPDASRLAVRARLLRIKDAVVRATVADRAEEDLKDDLKARLGRIAQWKRLLGPALGQPLTSEARAISVDYHQDRLIEIISMINISDTGHNDELRYALADYRNRADLLVQHLERLEKSTNDRVAPHSEQPAPSNPPGVPVVSFERQLVALVHWWQALSDDTQTVFRFEQLRESLRKPGVPEAIREQLRSAVELGAMLDDHRTATRDLATTFSTLDALVYSPLDWKRVADRQVVSLDVLAHQSVQIPEATEAVASLEALADQATALCNLLSGDVQKSITEWSLVASPSVRAALARIEDAIRTGRSDLAQGHQQWLQKYLSCVATVRDYLDHVGKEGGVWDGWVAKAERPKGLLRRAFGLVVGPPKTIRLRISPAELAEEKFAAACQAAAAIQADLLGPAFRLACSRAVTQARELQKLHNNRRKKS